MIGVINPNIVANTVRLSKSQWKGCTIIAEGATDARVLGRFVNAQTCRISVAHGKDNAIGALEILQKDGVSGVLAVVDKDCILLNNLLSTNADLFVTDSRDLETMMIQSPALEKVLSEYGSEDKVKALTAQNSDGIRNLICATAKPIGLLRLASLRKSMNLKFEGCNYGGFIDRNSLAIHSELLANDIINRTRNHSLTTKLLCEAIEKEAALGADIWDTCCGHDLTVIISIALRKVIGSCNPTYVDANAIERALRLSYEQSHFQLTQLYSQLTKWEAANPPYRIF